MGFPDSSVDKESACNAGDPNLIPGLGRSPGEGKGYPLQYSGLENSMGCTVHGVAKRWTRLTAFTARMSCSVEYWSSPSGSFHSAEYHLVYVVTKGKVPF